MGLEKLIDILLEIWERMLPCWIIWHYELGVRVSVVRKPKPLPPGIYFKIPFLDKIVSCLAKNETFIAKSTNITTKDGKTVSVSAVVGYKVVDQMMFLIENNESISNLHDIARGVIGEALTDCDWDEIKKKTTRTEIKNKIKRDSEHLGIEVEFVRFADIVQTRAFTFFKDL